MNKLNVDKQETELLQGAIAHWEKEGLIDTGTAENLRGSMEVKGFDWMRLAKYSFWIALFCGMIAIGSLIINDAVINWIKSFILCAGYCYQPGIGHYFVSFILLR